MIGLLCLGKPDFAAIEPFRQDPFFVQSLGLETCPSSAILRQRLDMVGSAFDRIIQEESAELLRQRAPKLAPISTSAGKFVPVDLDVSPFDNSRTQKEGVSRTYKGYDGYAPMFAYLGQEGYQIHVEKKCIKRKAAWIIKRNQRKEQPEAWLELAKKVGTPFSNVISAFP